MLVTYKVVSEKGCKRYDSIQALANAETITGYHNREHTRSELEGQPILKSLLGPMYDGVENGLPVVRYESQAVYDMLSR